jgi:hypothetical protein
MQALRSLLLLAAISALLPAAAAVQAHIVTDEPTSHRVGPGVKPNSVSTSTDIHDQYLALVHLYNATNGDKWTNNKGWLNGTSYCRWFGVTCDSTGNVQAL